MLERTTRSTEGAYPGVGRPTPMAGRRSARGRGRLRMVVQGRRAGARDTGWNAGRSACCQGPVQRAIGPRRDAVPEVSADGAR